MYVNWSEFVNCNKLLYIVVVDENDEDGDYDNVQSRATVAINTNNVGSVANAETESTVHSDHQELTATETVVSSGTTKQPGSTKVKKEKKMFSWGQKKKKKPKTAAGIHDAYSQWLLSLSVPPYKGSRCHSRQSPFI